MKSLVVEDIPDLTEIFMGMWLNIRSDWHSNGIQRIYLVAYHVNESSLLTAASFFLVLMAMLIWSLKSAMEGKCGKYKKRNTVYLFRIITRNTHRSRDKPWQYLTTGPTQTLSRLT